MLPYPGLRCASPWAILWAPFGVGRMWVADGYPGLRCASPWAILVAPFGVGRMRVTGGSDLEVNEYHGSQPRERDDGFRLR
jgi:hypothetical protein